MYTYIYIYIDIDYMYITCYKFLICKLDLPDIDTVRLKLIKGQERKKCAPGGFTW